MKLTLKTFIAYALALVIAATAFVFSGPDRAFAEEAADTVINIYNGEGSIPIDLSAISDYSVGAQFVATAPLKSVKTACPTWSQPDNGFARFSLYKFDTNYEKTVSADPVASVSLEEFDDNAVVGLEFTEDNAPPAGEYIFVIDEAYPDHQTGVWAHEPFPAGQLCYLWGELDETKSITLQVVYYGTPETPYGTPTKPVEETKATPEGGQPTDPDIVHTLILNDEDAMDYVVAANACLAEWYEEEGGFIRLEIPEGSDDPQAEVRITMYSEDDGVFVEDYPFMVMRIRRGNDTDPLKGEFFFYTENYTAAAAGNNVVMNYEDTTEWQNVIVNLGKNKRIREYFTGMRLDMYDHAPDGGVYDIAWITFFATEEAAKAFNGDFSALVPTKAPTATPDTTVTEAPAATDAPAATEVPATEAPTAEQNEQKQDSKSGAGKWIVIGCIAAAVIIAAVIGAVVASKKKGKAK